MQFFKRTLIEGDPMDQSRLDLIAVQATLPVGEPVPHGFRVMTGNANTSHITAVLYRYELENGK